jgi:hypothetical protein
MGTRANIVTAYLLVLYTSVITFHEVAVGGRPGPLSGRPAGVYPPGQARVAAVAEETNGVELTRQGTPHKYNQHRRHSTLGYSSPAEVERRTSRVTLAA